MKQEIVIAALICTSVLAGCSNNQSGDSKTSNTKTVVKNTETKYYQKLSRADQKQVKFNFTVKKSGNWHAISMKIKNNSDKNVKFKVDQFFISTADGNKVSDMQDGTFTVKPGKTYNFNKLFDELSSQIVNNKKLYFIYLNTSNKLGKLDFDIPDDNAGGESSNSSSTNNSSFKNSSKKIITSGDMAVSLYEHSMNIDPNDIAPGQNIDIKSEPVSFGYKILDNHDEYLSSTSYIDFQGNETDSNGNIQTPFAQLVGHTEREPGGWIYNGHNYYQQ
jgi:hypothetical protein